MIRFAEIKDDWMGYPLYEVLELSNDLPSKVNPEEVVYNENATVEGYLVRLTGTMSVDGGKVNYFTIDKDGYDSKGLEKWKFNFKFS